jgi:hypothetical protein
MGGACTVILNPEKRKAGNATPLASQEVLKSFNRLVSLPSDLLPIFQLAR